MPVLTLKVGDTVDVPPSANPLQKTRLAPTGGPVLVSEATGKVPTSRSYDSRVAAAATKDVTGHVSVLANDSDVTLTYTYV